MLNINCFWNWESWIWNGTSLFSILALLKPRIWNLFHKDFVYEQRFAKENTSLSSLSLKLIAKNTYDVIITDENWNSYLGRISCDSKEINGDIENWAKRSILKFDKLIKYNIKWQDYYVLPLYDIDRRKPFLMFYIEWSNILFVNSESFFQKFNKIKKYDVTLEGPLKWDFLPISLLRKLENRYGLLQDKYI